MAFKVFTNGSVLQASEVNENLMRQAVSTFSNSAARTAAITAPSEGMLTYLEDVDRYDHWNGSAWVSPFGATLLGSTNFSAVSLIRFNNIFSATYTNYLIDYCVTSSSNTGVAGSFRFLTATDTPTVTNTYNRAGFAAAVSLFNGYAANNEPSVLANISSGSNGSSTILRVINPFNTSRSTVYSNILQHDATTRYDIAVAEQSNTSFPGFQIAANTGTITGTIRVYGMRN